MATKKKKSVDNYIYAYYQGIKNGTYTVGSWIEQIYEYIIAGLESQEFSFDQKKANDVIEWIEHHCYHSEGPLAPGPFNLELWQKAFLSAMFGLLDENGNRQFREVALVVARKNGKSLLASAIAKYMWLIDGGYGARIYCIAPKLDQADIIYNDIWQHVVLDPDYQNEKERIDGSKKYKNWAKTEDDSNLPKHRQTDLYVAATNSTVKKIAFAAKRSDGFNPSMAICDEIASWPGEKGLKQYEVLKSGMGARPEGMLFSCSTAGYESDGIYDEIIKRSTAFLNGNSKEKRLLPFFYTIDDPDKWNDINELRKANPNLGVSVTVDYLLEEIAVAEGSLSKKAEFLTKYCNIKQNSSIAWLDAVSVDKAFHSEFKLEDFKGCYCVGGIDLSQTTDLTACCIVIEKNEKLYVFSKFFMPTELIDENSARDGLNYRIYEQQGLLQASGDNFVDYHDCYQWFVDLIEKYKIYPLKIGYDRYSAQYLVQDMKAYGFHMDDVYQGENLTPCIQEVEGKIRDGAFEFGENSLMEMHLLDSAVKTNAETRRRRLVKIEARKHIDGTAALLDAIAVRQKYWNECGTQLVNKR